MEALRTPDERFTALPDFPFAPHYVEVAERRRRRAAARSLPRRGPGRRRGRAADARRAVVVLPLPQDDPGAHRRRACAASHPTSWASAAPTSRPNAPTTRTRATSSGCAPRCSTRSTCTTSLSCARTGAASSACVSSASTPTASRAWWPRTPSCRPASTPPGDAFLNWQRFSQTVEDFDVGFIVGSGCRAELVARSRSPRTTRRSPTTPTRRARASSRCWCRPRPTIRPRPRTARRGRRCARGPSRSSPRSPTRTRSRAAATARSRREVPGCAGQPHTTIEGGGHFLQEDRGEQLARRRRELDHGN